MPIPIRRLVVASMVLASACTAPERDGEATGSGGAPGAVAPDTLRVLAYNIHHGAGNDEVLDLERIAALIRSLEPDLVALQEVDRIVDRTAGVDQAAVLGELTGLEPVFGAFMDYQGGEYGMAVLSAWPILESWNHRLTDGAEPRSSATIRVTSPTTGRELVFAGIHFYRDEEERLTQAMDLDRALADATADGAGVPTLLAGDFNSQPGGAVLRYLAGVDGADPGSSVDVGADRWRILAKDGASNTFPSDAPEREIDFVMVRPAGRWDVLEHRVIEEPVASDHAPIFAVLVVR